MRISIPRDLLDKYPIIIPTTNLFRLSLSLINSTTRSAQISILTSHNSSVRYDSRFFCSYHPTLLSLYAIGYRNKNFPRRWWHAVGRVNGFSMVISLGRRRSFRDGEKLTGLEAYASQDRCLGCNEARLGEAR